MKVSDFDAKKYWVELLTLDRFNRLLQVDILKNLFKFWKSTKDFAPSSVWGMDAYELHELEDRRYLAHATGHNPNKVTDPGHAYNHQGTISKDPANSTGGSGSPEMERMDSESKLMSDNDSINVGKKSMGTLNDVDTPVPKLSLKNVSMQEVLPISSDERDGHSQGSSQRLASHGLKSDNVLEEHSVISKEKKRNSRTLEEIKVVSRYEFKETKKDANFDNVASLAKVAEAEHAALIEKIGEAKKEKKNKHDDFATRWQQEMSSRGISSSSQFYDPTDLKNMLANSGGISPSLQQELSVQSHPAIDPQNSADAIDSIRAEYILPVDVKAFLQHLNALRSSPKSFATVIREQYLRKLDSSFIHLLTFKQYEEGKTALAEAEKALESQQNLPSITLDAGLCATAHLQAKRQAYEKSVFGPERHSQMLDSLHRFSEVSEGNLVIDCNLLTQNLNYQDILVNFFVGDGDVSRRGRNSLSNTVFTKCGFGVYQRTKRSPIFCTLILADKSVTTNKNDIPADLLTDAGAANL